MSSVKWNLFCLGLNVLIGSLSNMINFPSEMISQPILWAIVKNLIWLTKFHSKPLIGRGILKKAHVTL